MVNPIDLSCYLILDASFCPTPEKMAEVAEKAAHGGVTAVQIRAPEWKKRQKIAAAQMVKTVLNPMHIPVIIDDDLDIALLIQADGVHLGQQDLPPSESRRLLGEHAVIGISVGNVDELKTVGPSVDYLGVGPIFPTKTKPDAGDAITLQGLKEIRAATDLPIVRVGGINRTNAGSVIQAGADGVAVVSAILSSENPEVSAAQIKRAVDEAKEQTVDD